MEHYAGIDVSLELSSVCVVDAAGRIVHEAKGTDAPIEVKRPFAPGRRLWGHGRDGRRSRVPRSA